VLVEQNNTGKTYSTPSDVRLAALALPEMPLVFLHYSLLVGIFMRLWLYVSVFHRWLCVVNLVL
jgi:hypothetical protein